MGISIPGLNKKGLYVRPFLLSFAENYPSLFFNSSSRAVRKSSVLR